jgi:hypothetical protein
MVQDAFVQCFGGGQIDDQIRQYTGADPFDQDAMDAVASAKD